MNMNYTIDHAEGKIILTKEFNKRAGILGTPEYKAMMKLRKDFHHGLIFRRTENIRP